MREDEVSELLDGAQRAFLREWCEVADDGSLSPQMSVGELAWSGQHPADVASETAELEIGRSIRAEAADVLAEISAARLRLSAGSYGTCAACGAAISDDRLRAVPWTRWCVRDEERRELDAVRLRPAMDVARLAASGTTSDEMTGPAAAEGCAWDPEDEELAASTEEAAVHVLMSFGEQPAPK